MQKVLIETVKGETYTASSKARDDATRIFSSLGFDMVPVHISDSIGVRAMLHDIPSSYKQLRRILSSLNEGAVVAYQYPWDSSTYDFAKLIRRYGQVRNLKSIVLIHDINSLRTPSRFGRFYYQKLVREYAFINCFDVVICHNDAMKRQLVAHGVDGKKIIDLGAFDYLRDVEQVEAACFGTNVTIAGNLSSDKASYIDQLPILGGKGVRFDLFGVGYSGQSHTQGIEYHGAFPPDELCAHLRSGFGLVWDGDSIDGCTGPYGDYQRYNNPHKLSLYLACGLPVIVWDQAATARFVTSQEVGFTVGSLRELGDRLHALTEDDYLHYAQRAAKTGMRMCKGDYLRAAMEKALSA